MAATVEAMLAAAVSELGYTEEPYREDEIAQPAGTNRTKFAAEAGHANGLPWCATFEVALAHRIGLVLPPGADTASVYLNLAAWQRAGKSPTTPQRGDFAHFHIGDGHTGIVEEVYGDLLTTIDGNTLPGDGTPFQETNGGEVCRKTRSRALVAGYGRPDYVTGANPSIGDLFMDLGPRLTARLLYLIAWHHEPDTPTLDHGHYFLGQANTAPDRDVAMDTAGSWIFDHEKV